MNTRQEMADLLEQWLQMTHAEAGAIQSARWRSLTEIQAAKAGLQQRLTLAKERWEAENAANVPGRAVKPPFSAEIGRLLSLETRNAEWLAAKLRRAHTRRELLNQAVRNLGKLRGSYASMAKGAWNCYS